MVLTILCEIWRSGADVVLDNDNLDLINYERTPKRVIDAAINQSEAIEKYLLSWQGETKLNDMLMQAVKLICGWRHNEKLNKWLCSDAEALSLFDSWCIELGREGWSIYDDFRKYENETTNELKTKLYQRAVAFAKGVK